MRSHTPRTIALHAGHTACCHIAGLVSEVGDMSPRVQRSASAVIATLGLALVVMMITTEGELGALPLGLVVLGAVGYLTGRMRERSARQR